MMSMFMKILFRNTRRLQKNLILKKRGIKIESKPSNTIKDVKVSLMDLMGLEKGYSPVQASREHLLEFLPKSQEELPPRSMQDSFREALIPLSSNIDLQEMYVSFMGHLRLGRLLEDMDKFAVHVAYSHILNPKQKPGEPSPYVLLTVLVDQIDFTDFVPKHDADIRVSGHVSWVGRSSMETVVWMEQEDNGEWVKITRAIFLMAARNSNNTGSAPVNVIEPKSERDKRILAGGTERNSERQRKRETSLAKHLPSESEQQIVHKIFQQQLNMYDPMPFHSHYLPPNSEWMRKERLSTSVFSHPELPRLCYFFDEAVVPCKSELCGIICIIMPVWRH